MVYTEIPNFSFVGTSDFNGLRRKKREKFIAPSENPILPGPEQPTTTNFVVAEAYSARNDTVVFAPRLGITSDLRVGRK
jgi:hypothetical protein